MTAEADDRILLGAVEEVILLPWGVKLPARIDTGAATSSLDARDLTIRDKTAEFTLPKEYGGLAISLPIVKWKTVKSAGTISQRPVVDIEMCIGPHRIRTRVNLNDRSNVKYPLILGRNTIKRRFIIDCNTSFCSPPSCPGVTPK
ncbi:MAG: ATP-dependent zinc protease [Deltaproteobacteria bacterium]|nr:ATP-dependent zinc protease [Deltaproteobacteria bacterium]